MSRYTFACPMRWSDMDAYGHVNNVAFLTYLEEARIEMLFSLSEAALARSLSAGLLVHQSEITYWRPLIHRTTPVPIDVWVTRIRAAAFSLSYEVHDGDRVYATASSVLVPYDFAHESPRRLTPDERAWLEKWFEPSA